MHETMVGHQTDDHDSRSYRVQVIKTRCIMTRMKRHVRTTPISAQDYLRKEMYKANRPETYEKLNELTNHCALLN